MPVWNVKTRRIHVSVGVFTDHLLIHPADVFLVVLPAIGINFDGYPTVITHYSARAPGRRMAECQRRFALGIWRPR